MTAGILELLRALDIQGGPLLEAGPMRAGGAGFLFSRTVRYKGQTVLVSVGPTRFSPVLEAIRVDGGGGLKQRMPPRRRGADAPTLPSPIRPRRRTLSEWQAKRKKKENKQ